jgi:hypothetical protein
MIPDEKKHDDQEYTGQDSPQQVIVKNHVHSGVVPMLFFNFSNNTKI